MKKWVAVLATSVAAIVVWLLFFKTRTAPATAPPQTIAAQDAAVADALAKQNPKTVGIIASNFARVQPVPGDPHSANNPASPAPSGEPSSLQFTNISPAIALENVSRAVRQYGAMFGGNPVGTNPEITRQLSGSNPRHINFINPEAGMRTDADGELVDSWNTPYFFHQVSGTVMEIHSAGPDKILWTPDDLVSK
jgi:hypothetical protein